MNHSAFTKIDIVIGAVVAGAAVVGFGAFSSDVGLGLTVGALLMGVNFLVLRRLTSFILGGVPSKVGLAVGLLFVKLLLFFGAVWLAMTYLPMNVFAFGLGAALILLSVSVMATLTKKVEAER